MREQELASGLLQRDFASGGAAMNAPKARVCASAAFVSALLILCASTASAAGGARKLAPIPIEDALRTKYLAHFTSVVSSPDGRYVAYTIMDNDRADRPPAFHPWVDRVLPKRERVWCATRATCM